MCLDLVIQLEVRVQGQIEILQRPRKTRDLAFPNKDPDPKPQMRPAKQHSELQCAAQPGVIAPSLPSTRRVRVRRQSGTPDLLPRCRSLGHVTHRLSRRGQGQSEDRRLHRQALSPGGQEAQCDSCTESWTSLHMISKGRKLPRRHHSD